MPSLRCLETERSRIHAPEARLQTAGNPTGQIQKYCTWDLEFELGWSRHIRWLRPSVMMVERVVQHFPGVICYHADPADKLNTPARAWLGIRIKTGNITVPYSRERVKWKIRSLGLGPAFWASKRPECGGEEQVSEEEFPKQVARIPNVTRV
ncbi:hypothetical protein JB92DRAFT_3096077 [Gautieria morchelliformis]|nr:hypothetical protein JB92DRAFT_3096077 [Gautieria morchelliformis]